MIAGNVIGGIASIIPEAWNFFKEKSEKKADNKFKLQLAEQDKLIKFKEYEASKIETEAKMYQIAMSSHNSKGNKISNFANSMVRPSMYFCTFSLYIAKKIIDFILAYKISMNNIREFSTMEELAEFFYIISDIIFNSFDMMLLMTIISFYLGSRGLMKYKEYTNKKY